MEKKSRQKSCDFSHSHKYNLKAEKETWTWFCKYDKDLKSDRESWHEASGAIPAAQDP